MKRNITLHTLFIVILSILFINPLHSMTGGSAGAGPSIESIPQQTRLLPPAHGTPHSLQTLAAPQAAQAIIGHHGEFKNWEEKLRRREFRTTPIAKELVLKIAEHLERLQNGFKVFEWGEIKKSLLQLDKDENDIYSRTVNDKKLDIYDNTNSNLWMNAVRDHIYIKTINGSTYHSWILRITPNNIISIKCNQNGDIACLDNNGNIHLWRYIKNSGIFKKNSTILPNCHEPFAINQTGDKVAYTDRDGILHVWCLQHDQWKKELAMRTKAYIIAIAITFNQAGDRIALVDSSNSIYIWWLHDNQWKLETHLWKTGTVLVSRNSRKFIAFNQTDDKVVMNSNDDLRIYKLATNIKPTNDVSLLEQVLLVLLIAQNKNLDFKEHENCTLIPLWDSLPHTIKKIINHPKACQNCFTVGHLWQCAKCQKACYCSRDCQKADWEKHKQYCKKSTIS